MSKEKELAELVKRIIAGDNEAEAELIARYKDGVSIIIGRIVQNRIAAEDIIQETFKKSIEKIRAVELRDPRRLSGFISAIARNLALDYKRKLKRSPIELDTESAERIVTNSPDPYDQLLLKEEAEIVRQVIEEMKIKRDREVLFRYYILEEEKEKICADLGMTKEKFHYVIFRALRRFKELYEKRLERKK